MERYTIDPDNFTDGEWTELYYASQLTPRSYDNKSLAHPFKRSKKQIELAALCCQVKANRVRDGALGGSDSHVNIQKWSDELNTAADKLLSLIPVSVTMTRKQARARLYDLLNDDIYTDDPEYEDPINEIYKLMDFALRS